MIAFIDTEVNPQTKGFGFGIFIMTMLPFFLPTYGEATTLSGLLAITTSAVIVWRITPPSSVSPCLDYEHSSATKASIASSVKCCITTTWASLPPKRASSFCANWYLCASSGDGHRINTVLLYSFTHEG